MFNSKHPIICAAMNQVYSYEFACACLDAGITYGFFVQMIPSQDLKKLVEKYGPNRCIVSLSLNKENLFAVKTVVDCGVKNIEVTTVKNLPTSTDYLQYLKEKNHILYCKRNISNINLFDGVVVKGSEAAARGGQSILSQEFDTAMREYKGKYLIASGGIHNKRLVDYYISLGAQAVSVGTMFAASAESPLSAEAKQQIINTNKNKLTRFSNTQQSLVFSLQANDDENNTSSLKKGIQTGNQGHLFAGHAVDHITKIKSVAEIVADLTETG